MSHVTSKMAEIMERNSFVALVSMISVFLSIGQISGDRTVTTVYNPGCDVPECKADSGENVLNIAYVEAVGENDTLHYLISSIGAPTILVFRCEPHAGDALTIDWHKLASKNKTTGIAGAIHFSQTVLYSYGLIFTKLYEYDDPHDTANMQFEDNSTFGLIHKFEDLMWDNVEMGPPTSDNIVVLNATDSFNNITRFKNGSLALKFTAYNDTGRNTNYLPQLLFNDNIIQLDLIIDHLIPRYAKSRLGLEMVVTSTKGPHYQSMNFNIEKSIDDEYTPGVFKIVNLMTNPAEVTKGGFVQWKPVCYKKPSRARADATYVKAYSLSDRNDTVLELENTIMYAYYGPALLDKDKLEVTVTNVSFGIGGDGWYVATNYTVWTTNIGYGAPPLDAVSILVIGIISAGLGLPVIIIVFGGIFVCVKKQKDKKKLSVDADKRVN